MEPARPTCTHRQTHTACMPHALIQTGICLQRPLLQESPSRSLLRLHAHNRQTHTACMFTAKPPPQTHTHTQTERERQTCDTQQQGRTHIHLGRQACVMLTGSLCLLEEIPLCLAGRASFLGATLLARLGSCSAAMRALLRAICSARSRSYADISSTFCTSHMC